MTIGASLLNTVPIPSSSQSFLSVPSVKVGAVEIDENSAVLPEAEKTTGFWGKLREKLVQGRIAKLEKIPPGRRTEAQNAEILANQTAAQGLNCMV